MWYKSPWQWYINIYSYEIIKIIQCTPCCCLVTQLCPTLQTHQLQHTRLLCPSPSPRACSNSCSLSQWCHPTISSSVVQLEKTDINIYMANWYSVQFSTVTQLCLTLCDPMDCSMQGLSVLHHLPELAQTHVHQVGDVIQSSCLLSSPSPPAFNISQNQGPF